MALAHSRENLTLEFGDDILPPCFNSFLHDRNNVTIDSPQLDLLKLEPCRQRQFVYEKYEFCETELDRNLTEEFRNENIIKEEECEGRRGKFSSTQDIMISPIISSQDLQFINETDNRFKSILPTTHDIDADDMQLKGKYFQDSHSFSKKQDVLTSNNNNNLKLDERKNVFFSEFASSTITALCSDENQFSSKDSSPSGIASFTWNDNDSNNRHDSKKNDSMRHKKSKLDYTRNRQLYMEERVKDFSKQDERYFKQALTLLEKEEDLCSTNPLDQSYIDLQMQEAIKRERKKLRNRLAASKCRRKKLEREAQLEVRVSQLQKRKEDLILMAQSLRNQVTNLKQEAIEHINAGCQINVSIIPSQNQLYICGKNIDQL
ncbi:uncharacterized protein LOC130648175 [Hydractinia symbiolongicarpus]|uniref:uncharacterized protein LOC130648175 n=1 Tax=Hydractinia symbiolongicarpus TaxID=13093 RepID=UPI002550C897|nr:uncharacterized protein LOC130648175 [Hydractinia symbiolongicarpus]